MREPTRMDSNVVTSLAPEPLSPTAIDVELGFDGAAPQARPLDARGNGATVQLPAATKDQEPASPFAAPGSAYEGEKHYVGQAPQNAVSALFGLIARSDICEDHGAWGGTDWLRAEKDKINAIKDPNVRDAIFISHVQKEPDLNVRRTKRLLVTSFTSDSNGWSEPRGYWADWVRLEHGTEAPGNPQEFLFDTIDSGIRKCRKFVCFLSPEYLKSWACLHELALATKLQKDIVVARVEDVGRISFEDVWRGVEKYEGQIDKAEVEVAVNVLTKGLVWHCFDWSQLASDVEAFERQVWPFLEATDSDYADWDFHARLEVRCSEWMHGGKAKKLLLPRDEVEAGTAWVMRRLEQPKQRPQPSAEHLSFIAASEKKEKKARRREKQWYTCGFITCAVVAAALIALTIFFLVAKHDAQANERQAVASEARAEASEAKAVRQLHRAQVGQLMSSDYVTANLPETRLKVAATAVDLAYATSPDSDFYVMGILNTVMNDFSALMASRRRAYDLAEVFESWMLGSQASSRDGRWLARGSSDAMSIGIILSDLRSTTRQDAMLRAADDVMKMAFWDMGEAARGPLLVAVDANLAVLVWNLTSLKEGAWDQTQVEPPVRLHGCPAKDVEMYYMDSSLDISATGSSLSFLSNDELCIWDFDASTVTTESMADVAPQVISVPSLSDTWTDIQWSSARYASSDSDMVLQSQYKVAVLQRNAATGGWEIAAEVDVYDGASAGLLALSPDLRTLAVSYRTSVRIWKTSAGFLQANESFGTPFLTLQQATDGAFPLVIPVQESAYILSLAFSPDGRYLLAWSGDYSVRVWDLYGPLFGKGYDLPLTYKVAFEPRQAHSAMFSPASSLLITQTLQMSSSGTQWLADTYVWDVSRRANDGEVVLGREGDLVSVTFMPTGRYLASVDEAVILVKLYDSETGVLVGSFPINPTFEYEAAVSFSPDGQHLLVASARILNVDPFVTGGSARVYELPRVWDSSEGSPVVVVKQDLLNAEFSSTGAFLLGVEDQSQRTLAAYRTEQLYGGQANPERIMVFDIAWVDIPDADNYTPRLVLFVCASDDSFAAIAVLYGDNGAIVLINLPERAGAQASGPYPTPVALTNQITNFTHLSISALALLPTLANGRQYLVTSSPDKAIIFWDVSTSAPFVARWTRSQDTVGSLAVSADGQFLAMGARSGVEVMGTACIGSSKGLQSFTLTSEGSLFEPYQVAFFRNASLPAKILYGTSSSGFHVRTLDTTFMKTHLSSLRNSEDVYSAAEIDAMTGVLEESC